MNGRNWIGFDPEIVARAEDRLGFLKLRAKRKKLDCNLTVRDMCLLLITPRCHYSGIPIFVHEKSESARMKYNALTIDRIDSKQGYVVGNVAACAYAVNSMKSRIEDRNSPEYIKNMKCRLTNLAHRIAKHDKLREDLRNYYQKAA